MLSNLDVVETTDFARRTVVGLMREAQQAYFHLILRSGVVTWNDCYELTDRLVGIAGKMRERVYMEHADQLDVRDTGHLRYAAHIQRFPLVRADPVPCPVCDGAGGWGGYAGDGEWDSEMCSDCGGHGKVPRCHAEAIKADMLLYAALNARLDALAPPITSIDVL